MKLRIGRRRRLGRFNIGKVIGGEVGNGERGQESGGKRAMK